MNLLFVCSQNRWRSLTAEHLFDGSPGIRARSVGTANNARRRITTSDLHWADVIYVMEKRHLELIKARYPQQLEKKKVVNLHIPDKFTYMDPQLIAILKKKLDL